MDRLKATRSWRSDELAPQVKLIKIYAPDIVDKAKAGQFVIVRVGKTVKEFLSPSPIGNTIPMPSPLSFKKSE